MNLTGESALGVLCRLNLRDTDTFEVLFISAGSRELFGLSPEMIGEKPELLLETIDPRDRPSFTASLLESAVKLISWSWEGRVKSGDRMRWVRGSGRADRGPFGETVLEGILVDITDRKELELALETTLQDLARMTMRERERSDALRSTLQKLVESNRILVEEQAKVVRAEKLSSIGRLAAGVAHEINNPLTGVMACVQALREDSVPAEKRDQYFETITEGLERMRSVSKSLLELASPQAADFGPVEIHALVRSTLRLAASELKKKRVRCDVKTRGRTMYAFGDRAQLMQAFFNILINAVHASPIGGTVIIRLRTRGGRVLLRVLDHGPGIPQALIGRVCDPFFTTKPQGEGTGLGLALTLGIVEAHKGELTFDSREGEGTRVTMSIPALKRRRQATLPSHPQ